MIKKQRLIVLFLWRDEKNIYLKGWFTRHQSCRQDLVVKVNLSNTKNPAWFFYFGLPFRQRNATCKLTATEDYRVFHKIMFLGSLIIYSLSNGVVGETMN